MSGSACCRTLLTLVSTIGTCGAVAGAGQGVGVGPAECVGLDCSVRGPTAGSPAPVVHQQVWQAAGELHELKLRFVAAVQQVTRAQAGVMGDEASDMKAGLTAMRTALDAWDARLAQFDAATKRLPVSAELHVARGTVLLDRHRLDQALVELTSAARLDAERPDVPALTALAHGAAGRTADALRLWRRASGRDGTNVVALYQQAQAAASAGQHDEALRVFTRVAELTRSVSDAPRGPQAPTSPFERVGLLRQAAGVAPIFPVAIYADAFALLDRGDFSGALAAFDRALPDDPMPRAPAAARDAVARAGQDLRHGRLDEAATQLDRVVRQVDDSAEAHRALAFVHFTQAAHEEGLAHSGKAVQLDPLNERAWLLHADLLEAAHRPAEARQALEEAVRRVPASGAARYRLGQLHRAESRLTEALATWTEEGGLHPIVGRDQLHLEIGRASVDQADFDAAVRAYRTRVQANPNGADAHRQLGEIYFLQGRTTEALAEHSMAAMLEPAMGAAHAGRGHALARMQQPQAAVTAFERARAEGLDSAELRVGLGTVLVRIGRAEEGRRHLQVAQRMRADAMAAGQRAFAVETLRARAVDARAAGRLQEATALLAEALNEDASATFVRRDLGMALFVSGRAADAAVHLALAQKADPTAEGARALADAHNAAGNASARDVALAEERALMARAQRERVVRLTGVAPAPETPAPSAGNQTLR